MTKIYTRTGDLGETSLVNGERVKKNALRLEAYGTIDELNSVVGVLRSYLSAAQIPAEKVFPIQTVLQRVQNQLFIIGSQLACRDAQVLQQLPSLQSAMITDFEQEMDRMQSALPSLKNFILPGGTLSASQAHIARTVCRRAERFCVGVNEQEALPPLILSYLNRLNDYFFVLARYLNAQENTSDIIWEK